MSLDVDIFNALKSLVGNRVRPIIFPQAPAVPTWPAIRYTFIDSVPVVDICGDGDDSTATPRVQLDCVATTDTAARTLRLQVMAAMRTFDPPAILDSSGEEYDEDSQTYRQRLDYLFHGSS